MGRKFINGVEDLYVSNFSEKFVNLYLSLSEHYIHRSTAYTWLNFNRCNSNFVRMDIKNFIDFSIHRTSPPRDCDAHENGPQRAINFKSKYKSYIACNGSAFREGFVF